MTASSAAQRDPICLPSPVVEQGGLGRAGGTHGQHLGDLCLHSSLSTDHSTEVHCLRACLSPSPTLAFPVGAAPVL